MSAATPQRRLSRLQTRCILLLLFMVGNTYAQNSTNATSPTVDPTEARLVNAIFSRWGISESNLWNISGELCSGIATDSTAIEDISPGIKCDCSFSSNTVCRVNNLRVFGMSVMGPLPEELWNLTYLTNLNLGRNYLTGTIPASIGNLYRMEFLNFGLNALSGQIPAELGLLTGLTSLAFGGNNFSGPLPPDLGSLTRLTQLYMDTSGVSGPIPSTFANLRSLETVWASTNDFTGSIPDFIGDWSNLLELRFQGNSFQGPIPASFAGLTNLTSLRISDLMNGSSSLEIFRNMNNLSTLILRNNNISSSIPLFFSGFGSLILLDLSFNNLTGTIPDFLFNIASLTGLFLGNNRLTGVLPSQKTQNLLNVDVSYNELSGAFPSWINDANLQLNLVANNFTISGSNSRLLPSGLNCLQRNFPCNREAPIYSNFAVNCGGPQMTSNDNTVYERDNENLGPANWTNTGRWAVSNAGLSTNTDGRRYIVTSPSQVTDTLDFQLFQTARISAGSLRYYGLGLENGNYTVRLQFAETVIVGPANSWQTLGRRIFDIYIQGNLVVRNFEILREAGGAPRRAIVRDFTANVSENYLEIHFFWAGKGTLNVPVVGTYGPLISAISATPDFTPTVRNIPPDTNGNGNRTGLIVGIALGVGLFGLICLAAMWYRFQKRKRQRNFEDEELLGIDTRPYTYSYAELKTATNDFNPANKLGEGGFGPVYKGTLGDGREVAVKQLSVASHQGKNQFVAEIALISAVQHRNLVKLYGCCIEGSKRLLVYEYLENKSLDQLLFDVGNDCIFLDWPARYDICLGVARGLAYLHEESRVRIVHRDVKASNILLDTDLVPKISDFGLAKLYDDKMTHISTRIAGTIGYLAPEYAMLGHLTEKVDIFSFGIVALEIISGRPNTIQNLEENKYLLDWAWNLHESNSDIDLVDPTLRELDENEVLRIIGTAFLCTQASPNLRPSMSRVVAMLSGDAEITPVTSRPSYLTDWKFTDKDTIMTDIYKSTSNDVSHVNTSTSSSMYTDPIPSPANMAQPMLHEIISEGR